MAEKKSKKKAPKKTKVYACYHYESEYDDLGKYYWCHNQTIPCNECNAGRGFYCQQFCPGFKKGNLQGSWVISDWEKKEAEEYKIVTSVRADSLRNLITEDSPLGKALMGHRIGDRIRVQVNENSAYFVTIRDLEKGEDDSSLTIN